MAHQLKAGLYFAVLGAICAYILAIAYLDTRLVGTIGYDYLLTDAFTLNETRPDLFTHIWALILVFCIAGFAFGNHFASEKLTKLGTSAWQTKASLKRHGFLNKPGNGFILGKWTDAKKNGLYITSERHPNALVIAPTGAGKGVGFMYPNLFSSNDSAVVLDIKGENYDTTARWRHRNGHKIFKFAPTLFDETTHRYNPLERIGKIDNFSQRSFELRKIAGLFLQADGAGEWLNGAIQVFTVSGGIAYERGDFTLGCIFKVTVGGATSLKQHYAELAQMAQEPALKAELEGLAKQEDKTLSSYHSVLNNAGFDQWANPHICDMTSASDFSFFDLRKKKTSIYFVVPDSDLEALQGLVRLFFNELVATIQSAKPTEEEPYFVNLFLDEFHRLGRMPKVADAMTTIRGFNGRIAIITQTIPKLDAIYSREERLSIQGGAGFKLYMTPSDEMTIEDLSAACGMTTKRVVSKSRKAGLEERSTFSERSEEKPLLTQDEARRLDPSLCIIIVNGEQPIKAKRIVHYEDHLFGRILRATEKLEWTPIELEMLKNEQRATRRNSSMVPALTVGSPTLADFEMLKSGYDKMEELLANVDELPDRADLATSDTETPDPMHRPKKRTVKRPNLERYPKDI